MANVAYYYPHCLFQCQFTTGMDISLSLLVFGFKAASSVVTHRTVPLLPLFAPFAPPSRDLLYSHPFASVH